MSFLPKILAAVLYDERFQGYDLSLPKIKLAFIEHKNAIFSIFVNISITFSGLLNRTEIRNSRATEQTFARIYS